MPFRITWNYKQQAGDRLAGWTESFWWSGMDMTVATAAAKSLFFELDFLHGKHAYSADFRVADPENFRLARHFKTGIIGPNPDSAVYQETDYPVTALLMEMRSPSGVSRQWIRGIPDAVTTEGGKFTPSGRFIKLANAFFAKITGGGQLWSRRFLNPANELKPVTALDLATGIVTVPNHVMGDPGATIVIRLKGFAEPKSVNKEWRATVVDPNTLQLSFFAPITGAVAGGNNPTARLQTYVFEKITEGRFVRTTSHKTGGPSGVLTGKAPSKNR